MSGDPVARDDLLQDRYRIQERLGTGGMASVWRAEDEVLGRTVAVKVLDGKLAEDEHARVRLHEEARILARLSHPRVASVYDFGLVGDVPYLVMELVDGETLTSLLREGGLDWRLAVRICAQVAEALDAAHELGLVHRDISPANILWTRGGVKVIDFGLCASTGDPEETDGLLGTPAYMAPERIDGEPVRPASDVYALGVVLYRALADRLPWPTESLVQLLGAHRSLPPPPLGVKGVPGAVARMCERCLAKDPADRPAAAEVASALTTALEQAGSGEGAPAAGEPTIVDEGLPTVAIQRVRLSVPRPVALAASAAGLVALTGIATTWMAHSTPPPANAAHEVAMEADCHVDYQLTEDTGERFAARITVRNTGDRAYADWRLVFGLPGEQRLDPRRTPGWSDRDGVVTSQPQSGELIPGGEVNLAFAGRYTDANPFPTTFLLGERRCSAGLLGLAGGPAVPVVVAPQSPPQDSGGDDGGHSGRGKNKGGKGKD